MTLTLSACFQDFHWVTALVLMHSLGLHTRFHAAKGRGNLAISVWVDYRFLTETCFFLFLKKTLSHENLNLPFKWIDFEGKVSQMGWSFCIQQKKELFHDWDICVWVPCSQQSAVSCEISHWAWEGIKQGKDLNLICRLVSKSLGCGLSMLC